MNIIYVDSLFLLNLIINYFLLLCSARVGGAVLKRGRYALAAALGAVYAVLSLLPDLGFLVSVPIKLASAGLMALISFGSERRVLRCYIIFLCVSAAFGGAIFAVSMFAGYDTGGQIYIPASMRVLVLSFAVCYFAVSIVFRRIGKTADSEIILLGVRLRGRSVQIRALVDTGNRLHDPISGRSVAVAEAAALRPLFPPDAAQSLEKNDPAALVSELSAIPGCEARFRLIPYSALGNSGGLLAAFLPDEATLDGKAEKDLLIAISPLHLSDTGGYSALI